MSKTSIQVFCSGLPWRFYIDLAILLLVGCLVEGRPYTLENCGKRNAPMKKIIGGEWAMPGEYPWMVSLHEQDDRKIFQHICGATIINERYVVTAAHCIYYANTPSRYEVFVGLHRMSKKFAPPARRYEIAKVIVHEDYDDEGLINDIALLRTKEPIQFEESGGYVNSICLPTSMADPKGWGIVTGWGHIVDGGPYDSDVLRSVRVPLVPRNLCFKAYYTPADEEEESIEIEDSQICAGTANKDSCQDDSGGPLIQRNEKGDFTLIGIVSFGVGCGRSHFPGVYTKVASFMDWLDEHMIEYTDEGMLPLDKVHNETIAKVLWFLT